MLKMQCRDLWELLAIHTCYESLLTLDCFLRGSKDEQLLWGDTFFLYILITNFFKKVTKIIYDYYNIFKYKSLPSPSSWIICCDFFQNICFLRNKSFDLVEYKQNILDYTLVFLVRVALDGVKWPVYGFCGLWILGVWEDLPIDGWLLN